MSVQSAFVVQSGRQPPKSGLSDWTHEPRQQLFGVVALPGSHASPCFLQGFVQALASAQIVTPVSWRSVQQPLVQSEAEEQRTSHVETPPPSSVQVRPSQHVFPLQPWPCETQSPASAAGLEQADTVLPAGPVQKHDASSNDMQV